MRRIVITTAIGCLVLAVTAWLVFDPVMRRVVPALAKANFAAKHSQANANTPQPAFASSEWAVLFGGDLGRSALEDLANDESLMPEGREKARKILIMIDTNDFHELLSWEAEPNHSPWLKRQYLRWLLRQEQRRRPNLQSAPATG